MNKIINLTIYFVSNTLLALFFLLYIWLKINAPTSTWFVYPSFIHYVPMILMGLFLMCMSVLKLVFVKKFSKLDVLNFLTVVFASMLITFVNEIYLLLGTNAQILLLSFVLVYFALYSYLFVFLNRKHF